MDHIQRHVRAEWVDLEARRSYRRLEAQMREIERRCDALIDSSRDPIAYIHEGMHIRANAAYLEMFGFESFEDLEGMSLLDLVAPKKVDGFKKLLKQLSRARPRRRATRPRPSRPSGNHFPAVMEFTQATYEGESCLQVVLRKQEELVDPKLAKEVEALRQRDQVTGLLNRPTFLRALEDAVAATAQNATSHGLLLMEPDHYSRLLQDIGLDAADDLIAALPQRLSSAAGPNDVVARFSEHQFAVLAHNSDHAQTTTSGGELRAAFADTVVEARNHSLNITVSIGGVQVGEKIANVAAILGKASQGLQSTIGVGGNRFELFDPSATDRAELERVAAWVQRIREAIANDQFVIHFQPMVPLHGAPDEMYETLLRLRGEDGSLVQPMTFLPIAEEHGLLGEIDRWVVGRAIRLIADRQRAESTHAATGQDHPSLAAGRQPAQARRRTAEDPRCRRPPAGAADPRIQGVHQSARRPAVPGRCGAVRRARGAGAVRHRPQSVPVAHPLRCQLHQDRPAASCRSWAPAASIRPACASSPPRRRNWASRPLPSTCRMPAA